MKVAIFVDKFPEVSETFVIGHVTGLIDSGHEVAVFADENPERKQIHREVEEYALADRTFYRNKLLNRSKPQRIKKSILIIIQNLFFHPILILKSLNFLKFKKKAISLECLIYVFSLVNYDIIHCHFGPTAIKYLYLKEILGKKIRFYTTFHGYDISSYIATYGPAVYSRLLKKGDLFLPINSEWKKKLIELGCPDSKIEIIRMGVNLRKISFKKNFSLHKPVRLVTVGRLVEKKGIQYSMQAFAQALKEYPDMVYSIVGEGELKNELEDLAIKLNLHNKFSFLGFKNNEEILKLLNESDIFLLTSVSAKNGDLEGIPVSLMEAMASGVVVISSYHSGIPELIKDGISGMLVQEKQIAEITEKIKKIIEEPQTYKRLAEEARREIEENYNLEKIKEKINNLYKNGKLK